MDGVYRERPSHHIRIILDKVDPKHDWLIEAFVGSFGKEFVKYESRDESLTRLKVYSGGTLALLERTPSPASGRMA